MPQPASRQARFRFQGTSLSDFFPPREKGGGWGREGGEGKGSHCRLFSKIIAKLRFCTLPQWISYGFESFCIAIQLKATVGSLRYSSCPLEPVVRMLIGITCLCNDTYYRQPAHQLMHAKPLEEPKKLKMPNSLKIPLQNHCKNKKGNKQKQSFHKHPNLVHLLSWLID